MKTIKEKVLKGNFKGVLKYAKDYVSTIDEKTGKPYVDRTEDDVHGITLGELKGAIDKTLAERNKEIGKEINGRIKTLEKLRKTYDNLQDSMHLKMQIDYLKELKQKLTGKSREIENWGRKY